MKAIHVLIFCRSWLRDRRKLRKPESWRGRGPPPSVSPRGPPPASSLEPNYLQWPLKCPEENKQENYFKNSFSAFNKVYDTRFKDIRYLTKTPPQILVAPFIQFIIELLNVDVNSHLHSKLLKTKTETYIDEGIWSWNWANKTSLNIGLARTCKVFHFIRHNNIDVIGNP